MERGLSYSYHKYWNVTLHRNTHLVKWDQKNVHTTIEDRVLLQLLSSLDKLAETTGREQGHPLETEPSGSDHIISPRTSVCKQTKLKNLKQSTERKMAV